MYKIPDNLLVVFFIILTKLCDYYAIFPLFALLTFHKKYQNIHIVNSPFSTSYISGIKDNLRRFSRKSYIFQFQQLTFTLHSAIIFSSNNDIQSRILCVAPSAHSAV